jgi:hypothetical protein
MEAIMAAEKVSWAMRSSSVIAVTWPVRLWRQALWLEVRLPSSVLGPVECWALRMLAACCFSEIINEVSRF